MYLSFTMSGRARRICKSTQRPKPCFCLTYVGGRYLIFEFVRGGELFDYIVNHGRLEPLEALSWFKQIISGVYRAHMLNLCLSLTPFSIQDSLTPTPSASAIATSNPRTCSYNPSNLQCSR